MTNDHGTPGLGVLLVGEDEELCSSLGAAFHAAGFTTNTAMSGEAGIELLRTQSFAIAVLDLELQGTSGFQMLEVAKSEHYEVPIIVLTSRRAEADVVRAFRSGAVDVVTMPFSHLELVERIRVHTANHRSVSPPALTIDPSGRAFVSGTDLNLSPKEFQLLRELQRNMGQVTSKPELLLRVWNVRAGVTTSTLEFHIQQLRTKLRPFGLHRCIRCVPKRGYVFEGNGSL
jgi:DNA-binding response OmpR family regulator